MAEVTDAQLRRQLVALQTRVLGLTRQVNRLAALRNNLLGGTVRGHAIPLGDAHVFIDRTDTICRAVLRPGFRLSQPVDEILGRSILWGLQESVMEMLDRAMFEVRRRPGELGGPYRYVVTLRDGTPATRESWALHEGETVRVIVRNRGRLRALALTLALGVAALGDQLSCLLEA